MTTRNFFVHVHIPKTAGKTFQSILIKNFPPPRYSAEYSIIPIRFTADQIRQTILRYPDLQAIGSHSIDLDLPFDMQEANVFAIAHVRSSASRFISNYFYARAQSVTEWTDAKTKTLHEIVSMLSPRCLAASQLDWLVSNGKPHEKLKKVNSLLESGRLLLFSQEDFDLSCVILESLFPNELSNCSYRHLNRSAKTEEINPETLAKLNEAVSEHELELHRTAREFTTNLAEKLFGSARGADEKLAEFRARNLQKP